MVVANVIVNNSENVFSTVKFSTDSVNYNWSVIYIQIRDIEIGIYTKILLQYYNLLYS